MKRPLAIALVALTMSTFIGGDGCWPGSTGTSEALKDASPPDKDPCDNDEALALVCTPPGVEKSSPCTGLAAALTKLWGDADEAKKVERGCVIGCEIQLCPKLDRCDELPDPSWCGTSCSDMKGGVFWKLLLGANDDCTALGYTTQPALGACVETAMEGECWPLQGTDWADKLPIYK